MTTASFTISAFGDEIAPDLESQLQHDLNDLQQADLFGDENAEDQERLRSRIKELGSRKAERANELDLILNLSANIPGLLSEALIVPVPIATVEAGADSTSRGFPMHRDDEVEAIAMDEAMRYERSRGWTPTDVSDEREHYAVRSEGPGGERPRLRIIQNPFSKLTPERLYRQGQYFVEEKDWGRAGREVETTAEAGERYG